MGVANGAFAAVGLFHFRPHGPHIVSGGNHGEKQDKHAAQSQQALKSGELPSVMMGLSAAPKQVCRHSQQQPREIEQKFHI